MRDRLIELLNIHQDYGTKHFHAEEMEEVSSMSNELIADYIIADGWMRPPLNIGDKVWIIDWCSEINCYEVANMRYTKDLNGQRYSYDALMVGKNGADIGFFDSDIGKYVFLTREEAEAKLKGGCG